MNNNQIRGYVLCVLKKAIERKDITLEQADKLETELIHTLDMMSEKEAERYYLNNSLWHKNV